MNAARRMFFLLLTAFIFIMTTGCSSSKNTAGATVTINPDQFLTTLLASRSPVFDSVLRNKKEWNVQIIYTQIDRTEKGEPVFTDHYFNVGEQSYFYPASTVKLPIALLALQRINELKIKGLTRNTTMITEAGSPEQTIVYNDPTSADGSPSIEQYIKKILLVSDNDGFNRLYEFLGQEYINEQLHKMGYKDAQIIHRLTLALTEDQNRLSNPIRFLDSNGALLYAKPLLKSQLVYDRREIRIGKGFIRGEQLVSEPFDFTLKNRISLPGLHNILRSVIFPQSVSTEKRLNLSRDDYSFLYKYMSMYPHESQFPFYDTSEYKNNHAKLLLPDAWHFGKESSIRVFSKAGWSYGFLTDLAYIVDFEKNIEFMVSATIYCNSDGILNDDNYDYEKTGYPFLRSLSEVLYEHELKRKRTIVPDLLGMKIDYTKP